MMKTLPPNGMLDGEIQIDFPLFPYFFYRLNH